MTSVSPVPTCGVVYGPFDQVCDRPAGHGPDSVGDGHNTRLPAQFATRMDLEPTREEFDELAARVSALEASRAPQPNRVSDELNAVLVRLAEMLEARGVDGERELLLVSRLGALLGVQISG